MPLTLACTCNPSVDLCVLSSLHFQLTGTKAGDGVMDWGFANATLTASGGLSSGALSLGGTYDISLTPVNSWVAAWGSLNVNLFGEQTLSLGTHYPGGEATINFLIRQHWVCIDPSTGDPIEYDIYSVGIGSDSEFCYDGGTSAGLLEMMGVGGGGGGSILIFHAGPLADCTSIAINLMGFSPSPADGLLSTNNPCLCATGGTAPYAYSIASGHLPCGQTLNRDTGCVEGDADGTCTGDSTIEYLVTDATGAQATTTCNSIPFCSGGSFGNNAY